MTVVNHRDTEAQSSASSCDALRRVAGEARIFFSEWRFRLTVPQGEAPLIKYEMYL